MARTIAEIKADIGAAFISHETVRSAYGLSDSADFSSSFSPVSVENVMFYVVASCIWLLEKLFDSHKAEVEAEIETLRPHTLRWYVSKALEYMPNGKLILQDGVIAADYYDTTGMTDEDIEKAQLVKYAVATESNQTVYLKVATDNGSGPTPLSAAQKKAFEYYISQVKDAGVGIRVISGAADRMRVEVVVLYDPTVLQAEIIGDEDGDMPRIHLTSIDGTEDGDVIKNAVTEVISKLPFNGEYRNADLLAAIQAVSGVEVADITNVEAAVADTDEFTKVVGYRRPYSGYYALDNDEITVRGRAYQVAE
jgi:hypothetical protein